MDRLKGLSEYLETWFGRRAKVIEMMDMLSMPTVQAVLGLVVLCILIASGFWLVARFRDNAAKDVLSPEELLSNFEEMHREGDISGTEFRTIKASVTRTRSVTASSEDQKA